MSVSYQDVYESYTKFCGIVGSMPLPFEKWMHVREAPVENAMLQEANKLLHRKEQ